MIEIQNNKFNNLGKWIYKCKDKTRFVWRFGLFYQYNFKRYPFKIITEFIIKFAYTKPLEIDNKIYYSLNIILYSYIRKYIIIIRFNDKNGSYKVRMFYYIVFDKKIVRFLYHREKNK